MACKLFCDVCDEHFFVNPTDRPVCPNCGEDVLDGATAFPEAFEGYLPDGAIRRFGEDGE